MWSWRWCADRQECTALYIRISDRIVQFVLRRFIDQAVLKIISINTIYRNILSWVDMNQRIFWFFLVLLCHNRTAGESVQNPVAAEAVIRYERCSPNLGDRVFKLEAKNSQQEEEISTLKTTVLHLKDRVVHLETAAEGAIVDHVIYSPAKRPARLLPSHIFRYQNYIICDDKSCIIFISFLYIKRKEKNITNNEDNERAFEGPPTSCATLAKIGYTLNGYYLIKGKDQQSKNIRPNKIQIVFCRFKQIKFPGNKLQQMSMRSFQSFIFW